MLFAASNLNAFEITEFQELQTYVSSPYLNIQNNQTSVFLFCGVCLYVYV